MRYTDKNGNQCILRGPVLEGLEDFFLFPGFDRVEPVLHDRRRFYLAARRCKKALLTTRFLGPINNDVKAHLHNRVVGANNEMIRLATPEGKDESYARDEFNHITCLLYDEGVPEFIDAKFEDYREYLDKDGFSYEYTWK